MDISTFRWILIIVGIAIVAAIFLFGNPDKKRTPRASRKRNRITRKRHEPTMSPDAAEEDSQQSDGVADQAELEITASEDIEDENLPPPGPPPDRIVSLFLQARDDHRISGVDLLDAALKSGMVFGDRDIFYRVMDDSEETLFCMANLSKPGSFDKTAWNTLETNGVTMFMTLPGPLGALDAWDAMLVTSRRIAELLHADLLDDTQTVFTRQREGEIREDLREYERAKQAES